MSKVALFETLLGSLAFPWQHIHFVLRRPRDRPLSLVDRALATPDSLLLSQSSREGFESSLSVICDTLRVCFAGQVAKSANKMGVFACIPRDLTHLRTSLHTNMSNTHERWWHRLRHNSLCDPTRRCCVLPLTDARNTKDTERVGGGGGGMGGACMEGEYTYIALLQ